MSNKLFALITLLTLTTAHVALAQTTTTTTNSNAPVVQLHNNNALNNVIQNRLQANQASGADSMTKAAWMARAEQRFAARDTNGDGKIDSLDKAPIKGRVTNRTVTKAEFLTGMSQRFDALDKNHDGVLNASDRAASGNGAMPLTR